MRFSIFLWRLDLDGEVIQSDQFKLHHHSCHLQLKKAYNLHYNLQLLSSEEDKDQLYYFYATASDQVNRLDQYLIKRIPMASGSVLIGVCKNLPLSANGLMTTSHACTVHIQRQTAGKRIYDLGTRLYEIEQAHDTQSDSRAAPHPPIAPIVAMQWYERPRFCAGPMHMGREAFQHAIWQDVHVVTMRETGNDPSPPRPSTAIANDKATDCLLEIHDANALVYHIYCHGAILASFSAYFERALAAYTTSGSDTVVLVIQSDFDLLYTLLRYMYTGILILPGADTTWMARRLCAALRRYIGQDEAARAWALAVYKDSLTLESFWDQVLSTKDDDVARVLEGVLRRWGDVLLMTEDKSLDLFLEGAATGNTKEIRHALNILLN